GNGIASFTFKVSDDFNLYSDSTYTMTINVINESPTSANKTVTTQIDTTNTFTCNEFTFSDNDTNHNILNQVKVTATSGQGTFYYNGSPITEEIDINKADLCKLSYVPDPTNSGTNIATLNFKVSDEAGLFSATTYDLNVNVTNAPPESTNKDISIQIDENYTFSESDFYFEDPDTNHIDLNKAEITGTSGEGTFTYNGTSLNAGAIIDASNLSKIVYTPNPLRDGTDVATLNFKVSDDAGLYSDSPYNITIDVINDPPISADRNITLLVGNDYTFKKPDFKFTDPDSTHTTINEIDIISFVGDGEFKYEDTLLSTGILDPANIKEMTFIPNPDILGDNIATITFKVSDTLGRFSDLTYNITIDIIEKLPIPDYIPIEVPHDSIAANLTDSQARNPQAGIIPDMTVKPPDLPIVEPLDISFNNDGLYWISPQIMNEIDINAIVELSENKMNELNFIDYNINSSNTLSASVEYSEISMKTTSFLNGASETDIFSISSYRNLYQNNAENSLANDNTINNSDSFTPRIEEYEGHNNNKIIPEGDYLLALSKLSIDNSAISDMSETNRNVSDYTNTGNYFLDISNNVDSINLEADINYKGNEMTFFDSIAPDTPDDAITDDEFMVIQAQIMKKQESLFNNFKKIDKPN
ncbi:MAG: hypothetical protein JRJ49_10785, partial [Deltaproteobacteria bacterium]|nr:hypothetical protein [Deltaproteobacteria bacterium]